MNSPIFHNKLCFPVTFIYGVMLVFTFSSLSYSDPYKLIFVEGSETRQGEGWDNAIDGDREGWDGTVTTKGNPSYAIFKFDKDMIKPINRMCLATDNGPDDDRYECRQVLCFSVFVSNDKINWAYMTKSQLLDVTHPTAPISKTDPGPILEELPKKEAKYVKLVINRPSIKSSNWCQIVEFEVWYEPENMFGPQNYELNFASIPKKIVLNQNFPNPFNPMTTISYSIPEESFVSLEIYNSMGQRIKSLVNQIQAPGVYEITWNARDDFGNDVSSGMYFYSIKTGVFQHTRKAILMR